MQNFTSSLNLRGDVHHSIYKFHIAVTSNMIYVQCRSTRTCLHALEYINICMKRNVVEMIHIGIRAITMEFIGE